MSFMFVLQMVLLFLVFCECIASAYPNIQKGIFNMAFIFVVVWCTAKYAYGPDIYTYIPFYESLRGAIYELRHLTERSFEPGFIVFCCMTKQLGLSFWGMTALISLLYFAVLWCLLGELKSYRTFVLAAIVYLDNNLILIELRQCLAVTFFYIFIIAFSRKHYILMVCCMILSCTMHKSALIIFACCVGLYLLRHIPVTYREYLLLVVFIMGMMFLPLHIFWDQISGMLPLPSSTKHSISHHLLVGKTFQKVFFLYVSSVLCMAYYKRDSAESGGLTRHWLVWCCMAVVVCMYPYWFILNRLRSYFIVFIVIYIARMLEESDVKEQLVKQIYGVFVWLFILSVTLFTHIRSRELLYPTDRLSFVFERVTTSEKELIDRQMKQATLYWRYDYPRLIGKGITQ